jgi:DNA mismatch repair protein MutL
VARLTLTSRTRDAEQAWQVETEGRDMAPRVQPAAHPVGTSVEVRDLFFNPGAAQVPQDRKNRIRSPAGSDQAAGAGAFRRGVPSAPQRQDHPQPARGDDAARARRVAAICGPGFLEQALPIDVERNGLRLWGWVGLPTFSRSQADLQYFFVNGRAVRDKLVAHAVRQAYRDVLFNGRHPTFVLFPGARSGGVDVNVHPTKHEVRFREGRMVHDFLYGTLHRALADVRPEDQLAGTCGDRWFGPRASEAGEFGPQGEMRLANAVLEQPQAQPAFNTSPGGSGRLPVSIHPTSAVRGRRPPRPGGVPRVLRAVAGGACQRAAGRQEDIPPLGYALAQLKGIYILAENARPGAGGHARRPRADHVRAPEGRHGQRRPERPAAAGAGVLAVSQREADCAEEHAQWFQRLGFELQRLGPETLAIRQIRRCSSRPRPTAWWATCWPT